MRPSRSRASAGTRSRPLTNALPTGGYDLFRVPKVSCIFGSLGSSMGILSFGLKLDKCDRERRRVCDCLKQLQISRRRVSFVRPIGPDRGDRVFQAHRHHRQTAHESRPICIVGNTGVSGRCPELPPPSLQSCTSRRCMRQAGSDAPSIKARWHLPPRNSRDRLPAAQT